MSTKRAILLALGVVILLAVLMMMPTVIDELKTPKRQPLRTAEIICPDCTEQDEGFEVNVWETSDREGLRTVGQLPVGAKVTVLDEVDGQYRIRYRTMVGWIDSYFID